MIDERDLRDSASRVRAAIKDHARGQRPTGHDDLEAIAALFGGQLPAQSDRLAAALEHEQRVDLLTEAQGHTLRLLRYHTRLVVTGGAGTGKTWLALEQARRLAKDGQDVALLCYSRGLGRHLTDITLSWPQRERPAYVGLFHDLALEWGASTGDDDDPDYWEKDLPRQLGGLATAKEGSQRFDSVVVDEAQDFGELWWPSLLKCLRSGTSGGIYLFLDPAQEVFDRHAVLPVDAPPIVLEENVRNTRRIAEVFQSLSLERMRFRGHDGPPVRFVPCHLSEAIERADRAVQLLHDEGWDAGEIALLTTQSRHPKQVAAIEAGGWAGYWDAFAAKSDVFYGHVLGFKGLERPAVVLAVNGFKQTHRARQMLYVGLSRARSTLVVIGDLDHLATAGGEGVRRRLERAEQWLI